MAQRVINLFMGKIEEGQNLNLKDKVFVEKFDVDESLNHCLINNVNKIFSIIFFGHKSL